MLKRCEPRAITPPPTSTPLHSPMRPQAHKSLLHKLLVQKQQLVTVPLRSHLLVRIGKARWVKGGPLQKLVIGPIQQPLPACLPARARTQWTLPSPGGCTEVGFWA